MCPPPEKQESRTKIDRLIQAIEALTALMASQYAPPEPKPSLNVQYENLNTWRPGLI